MQIGLYNKEDIMKNYYLIATIVALSVSTTAFAAGNGKALFKKNKCNMCHELNNRTIGPSLKEISAKYAKDSDAPARLGTKVRTGGAGVWGTDPMPRAPSSLSDEEIRATVKWMLSHK